MYIALLRATCKAERTNVRGLSSCFCFKFIFTDSGCCLAFAQENAKVQIHKYHLVSKDSPGNRPPVGVVLMHGPSGRSGFFLDIIRRMGRL